MSVPLVGRAPPRPRPCGWQRATALEQSRADKKTFQQAKSETIKVVHVVPEYLESPGALLEALQHQPLVAHKHSTSAKEVRDTHSLHHDDQSHKGETSAASQISVEFKSESKKDANSLHHDVQSTKVETSRASQVADPVHLQRDVLSTNAETSTGPWVKFADSLHTHQDVRSESAEKPMASELTVVDPLPPIVPQDEQSAKAQTAQEELSSRKSGSLLRSATAPFQSFQNRPQSAQQLTDSRSVQSQLMHQRPRTATVSRQASNIHTNAETPHRCGSETSLIAVARPGDMRTDVETLHQGRSEALLSAIARPQLLRRSQSASAAHPRKIDDRGKETQEILWWGVTTSPKGKLDEANVAKIQKSKLIRTISSMPLRYQNTVPLSWIEEMHDTISVDIEKLVAAKIDGQREPEERQAPADSLEDWLNRPQATLPTLPSRPAPPIQSSANDSILYGGDVGSPLHSNPASPSKSALRRPPSDYSSPLSASSPPKLLYSVTLPVSKHGGETNEAAKEKTSESESARLPKQKELESAGPPAAQNHASNQPEVPEEIQLDVPEESQVSNQPEVPTMKLDVPEQSGVPAQKIEVSHQSEVSEQIFEGQVPAQKLEVQDHPGNDIDVAAERPEQERATSTLDVAAILDHDFDVAAALDLSGASVGDTIASFNSHQALNVSAGSGALVDCSNQRPSSGSRAQEEPRGARIRAASSSSASSEIYGTAQPPPSSHIHACSAKQLFGSLQPAPEPAPEHAPGTTRKSKVCCRLGNCPAGWRLLPKPPEMLQVDHSKPLACQRRSLLRPHSATGMPARRKRWAAPPRFEALDTAELLSAAQLVNRSLTPRIGFESDEPGFVLTSDKG